MADEIRSLSGHEMTVNDNDLALIVIAETAARKCSDIDGNPIIGVENAVMIVQRLRERGFEIGRAV